MSNSYIIIHKVNKILSVTFKKYSRSLWDTYENPQFDYYETQFALLSNPSARFFFFFLFLFRTSDVNDATEQSFDTGGGGGPTNEGFNLTVVLEPPDGSSLSFFLVFPFNSFLILPISGTIYTYVWRNFNVLPVAYRAYPRGKPPTLLHLTRLSSPPPSSPSSPARATPGHPSRIFIPRICINLISHLRLPRCAFRHTAVLRTSNFLFVFFSPFLWSSVGWLKKKKEKKRETRRNCTALNNLKGGGGWGYRWLRELVIVALVWVVKRVTSLDNGWSIGCYRGDDVRQRWEKLLIFVPLLSSNTLFHVYRLARAWNWTKNVELFDALCSLFGQGVGVKSDW